MIHRRRFIEWTASSWVFALLIVGCADYSADEEEAQATGGADTATGGGGTGAVGTGGEATGGDATGGDGTSGTGGTETVDASCDNVQPCGGDIVGTWTVAGTCVSLSGELSLTSLGVGCVGATVTGSTLTVTGTWTANSDNTFLDNLTWTGELQYDLSAECLTVSGTTTSCDRLASSTLPGLGFYEGLEVQQTDGVSCTEMVPGADPPSGCNCTSVIEQVGSGESDTYSIADNVITTSNGAEYAYCVEGDTLTLTPTKFARDTSTTTTGTVVLRR